MSKTAASWLGRGYTRAFGGRRSAPINHALFYLSARGLGMGNFEDASVSGEESFIRRLATEAAPPRVVFDIGAHSGSWTDMVRRQLQPVEIFMFEPSPARAAQLRQKQSASHVIEAAVGSEAGRATLFDYDAQEASEHASLVPGVIEATGATAVGVEVRVISVDDFCRDRQIDRVDLLKIDTEGYEYDVLRGASETIDSRGVRWIQFEFNSMNVLGRKFFSDFESLLIPQFQLCRLLRSGQLLPLALEPLWLREQFVFQNIIAVRHGAQ